MLSKYLKTILNGGVPETARDPLADGLAAFEAGDHDAAMPALEEAIALEGGAPLEAHVALGRIYMEQGRAQPAAERFRHALALDPYHATTHYHLADLMHRVQDPVSATEHFTRATQCDPDYTDAHIRLGMVLTEQRRFDEAIKSFEKAIFLDRTAVVARYHLAHVCIEKQDFRRALTQLHLVKELHPDYAPVYLLQGELFQRLGDYRQAIVELNKAVELGSGDANVYWALGTSHLALKQREKALRAFLQVIEHDPQLWPAYYEAALLQEGMKRYQQARQTYKALLEVPEYSDIATEAVTRIDQLLSEIAAQMAGEDDPEAAGENGATSAS